MFNYNPLACLPSAEELPDSDDTPVDNELQNLILNLLDGVLTAEERAERLAAFLRELNVDPDEI